MTLQSKAGKAHKSIITNYINANFFSMSCTLVQYSAGRVHLFIKQFLSSNLTAYKKK